MTPFLSQIDPLGFFTGTAIAAIVVSWIATAFALYLAGRAVAGKEATFGETLLIALVGPILFGIAAAIATTLFGPVLGIILALLVWLWVIKSVFGVGWGAAFAIAVLAVITFLVVLVLVGFLLGGLILIPFL